MNNPPKSPRNHLIWFSYQNDIIWSLWRFSKRNFATLRTYWYIFDRLEVFWYVRWENSWLWCFLWGNNSNKMCCLEDLPRWFPTNCNAESNVLLLLIRIGNCSWEPESHYWHCSFELLDWSWTIFEWWK